MFLFFFFKCKETFCTHRKVQLYHSLLTLWRWKLYHLNGKFWFCQTCLFVPSQESFNLHKCPKRFYFSWRVNTAIAGCLLFGNPSLCPSLFRLDTRKKQRCSKKFFMVFTPTNNKTQIVENPQLCTVQFIQRSQPWETVVRPLIFSWQIFEELIWRDWVCWCACVCWFSCVSCTCSQKTRN